jgi:hypothetical protein
MVKAVVPGATFRIGGVVSSATSHWGGEGDDLTYPSPVESIVESGSTALTKLPEYKKVKPNKARR